MRTASDRLQFSLRLTYARRYPLPPHYASPPRAPEARFFKPSLQLQVNMKIDLVYGGGSIGLMGMISQRVFDGGCHVLGVIPKALVSLEISGETVGEVQIISDMHERKAKMAREADAFIALTV